jgi:hypothetical protein
MSDPISKAGFCSPKPSTKVSPSPQQRRFALRDSNFIAKDDSYVNAADIKHADRHEHLMNTKAAYRIFYYISVIFGAHDERTPKRYRDLMIRITTAGR